MCFGGGASSPEPRAPIQPKENSQQVQMTADDQRRRRQAALGASNSRLTGPLGDSSSTPASNKTLLG